MVFGCDAILFDLDGVLIDSSSSIERHWREWAPGHGLEAADIIAVAHGKRTIETMRLVAADLDWEQEAERFTAKEVADTDGVSPIPGAAGFLASLPREAWAIVTSARQDLAQARLQRAGLPIPGLVVAADDVAEGKPAPEGYLLGAQRMGYLPERCIVVEDSPAGIEAARRAGTTVIAVATTHAKDLISDGDVVVDDLRDLCVATLPPAGFRLGIEITTR
jgi:HAD superfamily hydrolase (TIGR01509 family)